MTSLGGTRKLKSASELSICKLGSSEVKINSATTVKLFNLMNTTKARNSQGLAQGYQLNIKISLGIHRKKESSMQ